MGLLTGEVTDLSAGNYIGIVDFTLCGYNSDSDSESDSENLAADVGHLNRPEDVEVAPGDARPENSGPEDEPVNLITDHVLGHVTAAMSDIDSSSNAASNVNNSVIPPVMEQSLSGAGARSRLPENFEQSDKIMGPSTRDSDSGERSIKRYLVYGVGIEKIGADKILECLGRNLKCGMVSIEDFAISFFGLILDAINKGSTDLSRCEELIRQGKLIRQAYLIKQSQSCFNEPCQMLMVVAFLAPHL